MENSEEETVKTSITNHDFDENLHLVNSTGIKFSEVLVFPKLSKSDLLKLTKVVLRCSNLDSLPYDIPFINVVELDLSDNRLHYLPMSVCSLKKLQRINLSRNQFESLPPCMGGLIALKNLYLSENKLENLRSMESLRSLELLDLHSNKFVSFPESLLSTNVKSLLELDFSKNFCFRYETEKCIYELFDDLRKYRGTTILHTLKKLTLSNCQLAENYSEILILFPHLEELDLSNRGPLSQHIKQHLENENFLPKMPLYSMMKMNNLSILRIANVSLRNFSDEISKFQNLRVLDVKNNHLNWLPDSICDLKNLEVFDLSNNGLYSLPDNIGNLQNLSVLLLSSNLLSSLPQSFVKLKTLKLVDLFLNEFSQVPEILLNLNLQGMDLENNYFDSSLLQLKNTNYSTLLKCFRREYQLNRIFGFRSEDESEISEGSSDSDSSEPESSVVSESKVGSSQIFDSFSAEECWETDGDEDDYFDPHDPLIPHIGIENPLRLKGRRFVFLSPPVEGQFDDADSD